MKKNDRITPWYYDYHEKGTFPRQKELCEGLEWTEYNLEGWRRHPSDATVIIPESPANVLTIRLLTLKNALENLEKEIGKADRIIEVASVDSLKKCQRFGLHIRLHMQDSKLETRGAPVDEIEIDGHDKIICIRHHKIHDALYSFFSNAGSILDRLAYEINLIYLHRDWKGQQLSWGKITNSNDKYIVELHEKNAGLSDFIKEKRKNYDVVCEYRNRLIHDNILVSKISNKENTFPVRFEIRIPDYSSEEDEAEPIDAIDYCRKVKTDILQLLDRSYKLILNDWSNISKELKEREATNA